MRFITLVTTFFLLAAAVFAFNAVPSAPAIEDSDTQISVETGAHRPITLDFFTYGIVGFAFLLRYSWGKIIERKVLRREETLAISHIARGPPAAQGHALLSFI